MKLQLEAPQNSYKQVAFAARRVANTREPLAAISRVALFACLLVPLLLSCAFQLAAGAALSSGQQYFEVQPEPQYLISNGGEVRLRCLVRNRQGECVWLRNGRVVGPITKKYAFQRQPDDGDCSLALRNVSVQLDDGKWQCQVLAADVEQEALQSREVNLVVLVAPERPQIKNLVSS